MASPSPGPEDLSAPPKIPEEDAGDLPVALSASLVLTSLPRDGRMALDKALSPKPTKGVLPMSHYQLPLVGYIQNVSLTLHLFIVSIRFKAIGSAPILNKDVYKIKTNQRFENVVKFLRDNLGIPASESIFTYINATFAPALDENVGNLYNVSKCFCPWGYGKLAD
ncbi:uncharacterized protein H6S33_000499 [Morchella sextelata]|jgi:ubiquitin-like protein ATG12|uniref:uncharacterized protein n=1 Tax=Morchella sextelata TaxID=1174677 RepID=UPI001D037EE6|nr:uncharacterized protein H6S33_000499 [Morchella sextelata]KAH0614863.1 hypothetical protein H6S33_000499 [Morchella sextelata]